MKDDSDHSQSPKNNENPRFSFESSQFVRIPMKRIGAVIGKGGSNRREIEEKTDSKIIIDSDTGEVEVRPNEKLKDPVLLLKAAEIVKAVGRGFYYKTALKLVKDDFYLEVIRLKPSIGKNPKQVRRVKSRVIGTEGKTKKSIEELTGISLVISGSSIAIIGNYEQNMVASEAIYMIIQGSPIESVIKWLEEKKKEEKKGDEKMWVKEGDEDTSMEEAFKKERDEEEEDVFADYKDEDSEKKEEKK